MFGLKQMMHLDQGLSGFWLLMLGSVGVSLRDIPHKLWQGLVRATTMSVTVKDEDPAFGWVKEWLLEQPFQRKLRRIDLDTSVRGHAVSMMPAPGEHWFWHHGRPFVMDFERGEPRAGSRSQRRMETLTFTTPGRKRVVLERFVAEIEASHRRAVRVTSRLYVYDDYWNQVEAYAPRNLDAVLLPSGEKERLVEDLKRFRAERERYRALGVPYHRGYLFYGPPGTGKTSLVSAVAGHFGLSLYALNLSELEDRSLKAAMNEVPENSMVLLEDIDCMNLQRRKLKLETPELGDGAKAGDAGKTPVTLSGLLNVLDGFHAPDNVVFAMTTNDVDAMDAALLRPGRIDYRLYMGLATREQRESLYLRFFPEATPLEAWRFAEQHAQCTMAEFQGVLLGLSDVRAGCQAEVGVGATLVAESSVQVFEAEPARCSII